MDYPYENPYYGQQQPYMRGPSAQPQGTGYTPEPDYGQDYYGYEGGGGGGNNTMIILFVCCCCVVLGVVGYFLWQYKQKQDAAAATAAAANLAAEEKRLADLAAAEQGSAAATSEESKTGSIQEVSLESAALPSYFPNENGQIRHVPADQQPTFDIVGCGTDGIAIKGFGDKYLTVGDDLQAKWSNELVSPNSCWSIVHGRCTPAGFVMLQSKFNNKYLRVEYYSMWAKDTPTSTAPYDYCFRFIPGVGGYAGGGGAGGGGYAGGGFAGGVVQPFRPITINQAPPKLPSVSVISSSKSNSKNVILGPVEPVWTPGIKPSPKQPNISDPKKTPPAPADVSKVPNNRLISLESQTKPGFYPSANGQNISPLVKVRSQMVNAWARASLVACKDGFNVVQKDGRKLTIKGSSLVWSNAKPTCWKLDVSNCTPNYVSLLAGKKRLTLQKDKLVAVPSNSKQYEANTCWRNNR